MLHRIVATALHNVQEADKIARQIGVRIGDAVADAGLGSQIDDFVEALRREEPIESLLVLYAHADELHRREKRAFELMLPRHVLFFGRNAQFAQPSIFQEPMKPAAPVTKIFIVCGVELFCFEKNGWAKAVQANTR